jgi:hypothetical protein
MNEVVEGVLTVRRKAHKELREKDVCVLPSRSGAEPEALWLGWFEELGLDLVSSHRPLEYPVVDSGVQPRPW